MFAKIKSWSLFASTLGPIGDFKGASYYATLCSVPVVYFMNALSSVAPKVFLCFYVAMLLLVLAALQIALRVASERRFTFILGRAFFLSASFLGISINTKMIIFGSFFYLLLSATLPIWLEKTFSFRIQELPELMALLAPDVSAALLVNIVLRLMVWIVH